MQREQPLIHILHDQQSELVCTRMMRFLKQSVVGNNTGQSLLSLDIDNTNNSLKHDQEMEISEPTLKNLDEAETRTTEKSHNGHMQFLSHCHKLSD